MHKMGVSKPLRATLKEISRSLSNPENLRSLHNSMFRGVFGKFLSDFRVYLGGNSFSQRIGNISRNKKF